MKHVLCFFALLLLAAGCDNDSGNTDTFDRSAMLNNYATRVIQPGFNNLRSAYAQLHATVGLLAQDPTPVRLLEAQNQWRTVFLAWQYANSFNFGPAGEAGLQKGLFEEIGTFPAAADKIEQRIAAGSWNFNDFDRDARGLLALEYLLFRRDNDITAIVNALEADEKRRNFLNALSADINTRIETAANAWQNGYLTTFVDNDGTDVGSSTSQLYNEFVRGYEAIKNFKLGLPLGKRPGQVQTEPQRVEAYYSRWALRALKEDFRTCEDFWYGRSASGDFDGFRAYLLSVEGGPALVESTEAKLISVNNALNALPENADLAESIEQNDPRLETLHTELQQLTRFFKSDMSSLLGIAITFSSGDGD